MTEARIVHYDVLYASAIRKIRNRVFSQEQKVLEEMDFDGKDPEAIHVLVREGAEYVGTGRMLRDGHIGRLAVLKEHRRKGFGAEAVRALVEEAKRLGMKRVFLGAQLHAAEFYRKLGFREYGDPFMEVNIEHIHMEKMI